MDTSATATSVLGSLESPGGPGQASQGPYSSIIAGHRSTRRALATSLAGAGWQVETTGDLNYALYRTRQTQPDAVLLDLRLARAGHHAGLAWIPAIAPRTMVLTFGSPRHPVSREELGAMGIWCHLDALPEQLRIELAVGRLHERFLEALHGEDAVVPQCAVAGCAG